MKTSERKKYRFRQIRTMEDLKQEQVRLKFEIRHTEDQIRGNYHRLIEALTFRNILANLTQEFAVTSSLISKAVEAGRTFFARKKKKKKKKKATEEQIQPEQPETESGPEGSGQ